ncbi:MAG: histidine phosphatase family protein [Betaproteobacteria bacterium]
MDIILWRHAEAEELATSDLARSLTKQGERQAAHMARWLLPRLGKPSRLASEWRVVASPAVRAQQTAAALGMSIDTVASIAPDAPPDAILRAVNRPNEGRNVIVVGHQPTLGMVAARLANGIDGYFPVNKGAIWWFRLSPQKGESPAVLVAMMTPDMVEE